MFLLRYQVLYTITNTGILWVGFHRNIYFWMKIQVIALPKLTRVLKANTRNIIAIFINIDSLHNHTTQLTCWSMWLLVCGCCCCCDGGFGGGCDAFGDEGATGVDLDDCCCSIDSATEVGNVIFSSGTGPFSPGTTPEGRCLTVPSKRHPSSPLESSKSLSPLQV